MNDSHKKHADTYLQYLSLFTPTELDYVRTQLKIQTLGKREFFLKCGEIQKDMGFISVGLMRRYFINEKGNDITTGFAKEHEYVTDYAAFIQQKPTKYYLQCIEPSVVVTVPYEIIQESYQTFKQGQLYGRLIAEQILSMYNERIESYLFLTAEERYLKFITEHADLMNRVSLTHLSSFLGIERQSLSRIRKRISNK